MNTSIKGFIVSGPNAMPLVFLLLITTNIFVKCTCNKNPWHPPGFNYINLQILEEEFQCQFCNIGFIGMAI